MAKLFPQLEIIELLGQGGMGAVYKARQPRLNRFVALKILSPEKQNNPQFAERFEREARALAWLNQPNIVTVYDFGETQGMFYLLMEFVDGLSLRQLLQQRRLAPTEALAIVIQICQALQYAHEQGVIHRDIKPENILLDKKGQVKIADFGIVKLMEPEPQDISLTGAADVVGTPHYMAPEQIEKPQTVDQRADIYSLGVVFYEMLTGELPLGKFQPPSQKVQIDVRLDEVVLHALEKEPARRYQEAGAVKTAVETIVNTTPPTAEAERLTHEYLAEDYTLDIGHCIRRGWILVWSDFWRIIGVTILILSLRTAALVTAVGLVVSGPLMGGLCLYFLKKIRGEPAKVGMAFSGFSKAFLPLFLASLLMGLFTFFGFICLLLPGIYLTVGWTFTLVLVVDKHLGFWPAMGLSRKTISKHWWKFFGFIIVLWLMNMAGMLVFFVGSLITVPAALAALMFAYEDVFNPKAPADLDLPVAEPAQTARQSNHILGWSLVGLLLVLVIVGLALNHARHVLLHKMDAVATALETNSIPAQAVVQPSAPVIPVANPVTSNRFENLLTDKTRQSAMNSRQQTLRERFVTRTAQDQENHTPEQLRDAEQLYQVTNQKWGTPEAKESLQTMIRKYPDLNRTGCAVLYLAQMSQGDERAQYLQECIDKYNDCFYGDGVQVGAYARFLLAQDYKSQGDTEKAKALFDDIKSKYAGAMDHRGILLVDSMDVLLSASVGGSGVGDFENRLNANQRLVLEYINSKFARYADGRSFDGWSTADRVSLEKRMIDTLKGPQSDEYYQAINTLAALHSKNALP